MWRTIAVKALGAMAMFAVTNSVDAQQISTRELLDRLRPEQPQVATTETSPSNVERKWDVTPASPAASDLWGLAMPQPKRTNPSFDPSTWMPRPESSAILRSLPKGDGNTTKHLRNVQYASGSSSAKQAEMSLPTGYGSRIADDLARKYRQRRPNKVSRVPQAMSHIRYGFDLARRGASNTAREEFSEAMWAIAQANDAAESTNRYSEALGRGFQTMREADQFTVATRVPNASARVAKVARHHQSPAARDVIRRELGPVEAMQVYFASARSDFVTAVGNDPAGSLALFGLARSYLHQSSGSSNASSLAGARSMTLLLAAHQMDSEDHRVSNELGVMYAKYGDTNNAEKMLKRSLVAQESPEAWQNISKVWVAAGKDQLASYAGQRSTQLGPSERKQRAKRVRFVEPEVLIAKAPAVQKPAVQALAAPTSKISAPPEQFPDQLAAPQPPAKKKWWQQIFSKSKSGVAQVSATQAE